MNFSQSTCTIKIMADKPMTLVCHSVLVRPFNKSGQKQTAAVVKAKLQF